MKKLESYRWIFLSDATAEEKRSAIATKIQALSMLTKILVPPKNKQEN